MNDTLGPDGLVPSAMVFGDFPQVYIRSELPRQLSVIAEIAQAASIAQQKMKERMAELKLKRAPHNAVPPAFERRSEPVDKVLVWREKKFANRISEWLGAFDVQDVEFDKKL